MRLYRDNPDLPINYDWFAGGIRTYYPPAKEQDFDSLLKETKYEHQPLTDSDIDELQQQKDEE